MANLVGGFLGLYAAYHMEQRHREYAELQQLYAPLDLENPSEPEEDMNDPSALVSLGFMLVRTGRIQDPCDFLTHTKGNLSMLSHVGGRTGK